MSEEDLNTYKKYVSDLDITNYIVLDIESNYWYSTEYVDKMFKKQDLEIERLNNIINKLEKRLIFDSEESNEDYVEEYLEGCVDEASIILDYLQELKGSGKK